MAVLLSQFKYACRQCCHTCPSVAYSTHESSSESQKKFVCQGVTSWLERLALFKLREDAKQREEQKRSEMINSTWSLMWQARAHGWYLRARGKKINLELWSIPTIAGKPSISNSFNRRHRSPSCFQVLSTPEVEYIWRYWFPDEQLLAYCQYPKIIPSSIIFCCGKSSFSSLFFNWIKIMSLFLIKGKYYAAKDWITC